MTSFGRWQCAAVVTLVLLGPWGLTRRAHAMEVDEVLTRAALCQPTAAIPHPCRRLRGRRAGATPWRGHGRP